MAHLLDASTAILRAVPKATPGADASPTAEGSPIKTTVALPAELWRAAKIKAMDDRCDLRTVLIRALEAYLDVPHRSPTTRRRGRSDK